MGPTRRTYLALLLSTAVAVLAAGISAPVQAKDGDGGSGSGGSSGSSGGSGSSGSSGSSGGSGDSSGHRGGDDGAGDDHGGDNDRAADEGGSSRGSDHDWARDAVRDGEIMSLKSVLKTIDAQRYGRVIDIRLSRGLVRNVYELKLRDAKGTIRSLRVDARTGAVLGSN